ncbi:HPr(Ser) kinase/phosphatase [Thermithiobacillus plumbiphilus]|uniref:HPr kinase/phosphorylase n=1 Tax=Thermithiobacillus plumbiphilus TaxID=1729899 RepID=A0ABU9DAG0_9PROT
MLEEHPGRISVNALFEQLRDPLQLVWVAGRRGGERCLETLHWTEQGASPATSHELPRTTLVGPLNFIHPNLVQVLGAAELHYLEQHCAGKAERLAQQLFVPSLVALVIGEGRPAPDFLLEAANAAEFPVFSSSLPAPYLVARIQYFLSRLLAERETRHGVFMDVLGMGIFLMGESGIGKSELALELLSHGHRLIADDAVEFARTAPDVIVGSCPPAIQDYLEVRGLGIINIRDMFGTAAILRSKRLRLAVELKRMTVADMAGIDRLRGAVGELPILGVSIPRITLPVMPGRNLAVLVEVAARSQFLKESGVDTLAQFEAQLHRSMIPADAAPGTLPTIPNSGD